MPTDLYTLQLEPYDDAISVRDHLTFVDARHVALLWPSEGRILRSKLDLLLVQRQAARLGMRLALITHDQDVIDHAHDLNLSVFPDEQAAATGRWKRPRDKIFAPPRDPTRDFAAHAGPAGYRQRRSSSGVLGWRYLRWTVFAGLLAALVIGFLVTAPSATVSVTPASRQVYETVSIVADPALTDVDIENHRMPAAVVSLQATSRVTVQSSGLEHAGASLAQGLVTFANTTDQPILIPLRTVVATSGTYPVRFETLVETTLPAGDTATIQVPVRALDAHAGVDGNVDPGAINRVESDFADWVTVTNPNATYGGAVQERRTVTAEDHDRLLVLGRQQVLQNARDLLLHQLSGEQFLVPGSVTIIQERPEWTVFSAFVGDAAESVSLDLRAEVQAVIVDDQQARQVAYSALAPYIRPGLEISPQALTFARGDIVNIEANGRVTFLMVVKGNIAVAISADYVRDRVTGVSVSEAYRRLERELLLDPQRPPEIKTWPGWYHRLPVLPVRITVRVKSP